MSFERFNAESFGEDVFSGIGIENISFKFDDGSFEDLKERVIAICVANVDKLLITTRVTSEIDKVASTIKKEMSEGDTLIYTKVEAMKRGDGNCGDVIRVGYKILKKEVKEQCIKLSNFVPQIWKDSCYMNYEISSVMVPLMHREYEGTLSDFGDTVKMRIPNEESGEVITFTPISDDDRRFLVTADKEKVVVKMIDDIGAVQSSVELMGDITNKMGCSWSRSIDEALSNFIVSESTAISKNTIYRINSMDIENFITMMEKKFDDANLPEGNRVAVIPPWFVQKCTLSDLDRSKFKESKDPKVNTTGYVFSYRGFDFYKSNSVRHSGTDWYELMFFIREESIGFVDQATKMIAYKLEGDDRVGIKGVLLCGTSAIRPSSIFSVKLAPGSENVSEIDKELRVVPFSEYKEKVIINS